MRHYLSGVLHIYREKVTALDYLISITMEEFMKCQINPTYIKKYQTYSKKQETLYNRKRALLQTYKKYETMWEALGAKEYQQENIIEL